MKKLIVMSMMLMMIVVSECDSVSVRFVVNMMMLLMRIGVCLR